MASGRCHRQPMGLGVLRVGDAIIQTDFPPVLLAAVIRQRFLNIQSVKGGLINTTT